MSLSLGVVDSSPLVLEVAELLKAALGAAVTQLHASCSLPPLLVEVAVAEGTMTTAMCCFFSFPVK